MVYEMVAIVSLRVRTLLSKYRQRRLPIMRWSLYRLQTLQTTRLTVNSSLPTCKTRRLVPGFPSFLTFPSVRFSQRFWHWTQLWFIHASQLRTLIISPRLISNKWILWLSQIPQRKKEVMLFSFSSVKFGIKLFDPWLIEILSSQSSYIRWLICSCSFSLVQPPPRPFTLSGVLAGLVTFIT